MFAGSTVGVALVKCALCVCVTNISNIGNIGNISSVLSNIARQNVTQEKCDVSDHPALVFSRLSDVFRLLL